MIIWYTIICKVDFIKTKMSQTKNQKPNISLFGMQWWEIITALTAFLSLASLLLWVGSLKPNQQKTAALQANKIKVNGYNLVLESDSFLKNLSIRCQVDNNLKLDKGDEVKLDYLDNQNNKIKVFYEENNSKYLSKLSYSENIQTYYRATNQFISKVFSLKESQDTLCIKNTSYYQELSSYYQELSSFEYQERSFVKNKITYRGIIFLDIEDGSKQKISTR
jgi:hypothetical protein